MAITVSPKGLTKEFSQLPKDYHFASVVALTRIAKKIQGVVRGNITKDFTLRNRFTSSSIRIVPASKKDKNPFSEVYSNAWYLPTQDEGGTRSGKYWVPGENLHKRIGRSSDKVVPKGFKSANVMKKLFPVKPASRGQRVTAGPKGKAHAFKTTFKSGLKVIAVRDTSARLPISVLWLQTENPRIVAANFFEEPAQETFDKDFEGLFDDAWNQFVLNKRV